jgi:mono/diheme cytochrome c family protein
MASRAAKGLISAAVVVGSSTVGWAQEVDAGRYEYQAGCAACHGADGKGGGPVSSGLTVRPADLTVLAKKNNGVFPLSSVYDTIYGIKTILAPIRFTLAL